METYDYGAGTYSIYDEDIEKRESLVREIKYKGFENVIEEVAYTWFNRIIAIRFMEVNDYLPTRTRVLSSELEGKTEPDIITEAFDLDLDYSDEDREKIFSLKESNKENELFQFLFIKQCNKLNEILPGLFEKTEDYMELLLNINFTDSEGIIRQLVDNISEEDFHDQVEIIGWLYQYYNIELKDDTYVLSKKGIKVSKERLPSVTQLFTPDYVVKYMVENSLGRLWLEGHPNSNLREKWKFYIDDAKQNEDVELQLVKIKEGSKNIKPENILVIDPCMGSGHVLVYIFDVLMDIYLSQGYSENDAVENILKYNLYGLDIDDRAYQLSYFAVMMKARKYSRKILNNGLLPSICSVKESNSISNSLIELICESSISIKSDLTYLINKFRDAKEYGSLIEVKKVNFDAIEEAILNFESKNKSNLNFVTYSNEIPLLKEILTQAKLLGIKYDVVVTNPPYLGQKIWGKKLKDYVKSNFPNSKADLCTVFIEKCHDMTKINGFSALITQQSFMFLSTFENLRNEFLNDMVVNMVHLGVNAFEEIKTPVVQTTSFVRRNISCSNFNSSFIRLVNFDYFEKQNEFFNSDNLFITSLNYLKNIPSSPFAYWVSKDIINAFNEGKSLNPNFGDTRQGMATSDNKRFLRYWFEVNNLKLGFNCANADEALNIHRKWYPYNKGGLFRKWWGNQDYVINYENDGFEVKNLAKQKYNSVTRTIKSISEYFKPCLSWSKVSGSNVGFRFYPKGFIFDVAGCCIFFEGINKNYLYLLGFLNSVVCNEILHIISPTLNYEAGHIASLPILFDGSKKDNVDELVKSNIEICRNDWNDYESSWEFTKHPFLKFFENNLKLTFSNWEIHKNNQFELLRNNENQLNMIFSQIYSSNFNIPIEDSLISINKADYNLDVKSFISYAIGCMFGRYSLDEEGIVFAGGEFDLDKYSKFVPDEDNIIPVLDTEYFEDDIVGRFVEFVKACFGEETLKENLEFIANALNKKGKTSREIIRNYFLTDFFKDHTKVYQKHPIYWMFNSGKQNAFNCLIYMHRYDSSMIARVRIDYLHKTQKSIEQNLAHCETTINNNSSNKSEISKATKDKTKYVKQLDEIKLYDEALRHLANQNIEIDLDDGVKVNYAKFQNVEIYKEGEKAKKINLLKKI